MNIEWREFSIERPEKKGSERILTWTPHCNGLTHEYRIIPFWALKTVSEATHWAYLEPPKQD